jgi:glycosyltransferase involved in cell wall biosynthesis
MLISYVLPVYNQQNSIAQCLESLFNQSHVNNEYIIINDGSNDATTDIMDILFKKYKDLDIKYIYNKERKGASKCRNIGNIKANGDVIAVCDADIYYKQRGEAIADFFEHNKEIDVFCSALHLRNHNHPPFEKSQMDAFDWDFKSKCPISHPTVAYRKRIISKVRYHEESIDTDLYEFFLLDCHKNGFKINGCQDPLMCKIEGDSNRDKSNAKEIKIRKYKDYGIEGVL